MNSPDHQYNEMEKAIAVVLKYYVMSESELLARNRMPPVIEARQLAMVLCGDAIGTTDLAARIIGKRFGMSHDTVKYSWKQIANLWSADKRLRSDLNHLRKLCAQ